MRGNVLNLPRRKFLHLAAGAAALPALSRIARAQTYPTKPINIVIPLGAGTGTDTPTRIIAQPLGVALRQTIVIENKPGANGAIGATQVARAPADVYTLL